MTLTFKERLVGSVAVAGWLAIGASYVWPTVSPEYSELNKERIFLVWVASGIAILLWIVAEKRGRRMTFFEFVLWGGGLGMAAGAIAWGVYALGEKSLSVTTAPGPAPAQADAVAAAPVVESTATAPSDELEFYFFAFLTGAHANCIDYSDVTMTNRSSRKMHLDLRAHVDFYDDNGAPQRYGFQPEWNPDGLKTNTGQSVLDFGEYETKKGRLVLFFPDPKKSNIQAWNLGLSTKVYIHAFDSVTGKHIAFKANSGYPTDKMPWPLPSHKELLALEFPKSAASDSNNLPPLESLDLLARTQFFGYRNDNSLSISAVITNRSKERMNLQVNLLTRKSVDDKEWKTFRAIIVPSRKEDRGELDYYALDFGPGDVASCSLVVAKTGFTNKEGGGLNLSPSVSLLEIFDEVSRKKVWCAIEPGYPPGADMRTATIQKPPPIPETDSGNPQKEASNDSK